MQRHNFIGSPNDIKMRPGPAFTTNGCDTLAQFQKHHPGHFVHNPVGYTDCRPGFWHYQCDGGAMVGLKTD